MLRALLIFWTGAIALQAAEFPLRASRTGRYLVDAKNKPFLYQADTAWTLFLKLDAVEAEEYLRARRDQGFNAIQVQLTGFLGMTNHEGELPFGKDSDFARPNEKFFSHVDAVMEKARELNMYMAIAPLWSGCCGEGWAGKEKDGRLKPMNRNGPEGMDLLGRWIGKRYGRFQNVMWILGGDNDPDNAREEIRSMAMALKETAPHQLLTYHAASSHSSTDVWPNEKWIDVSMVYTYFRGFNKAWNKNQPDVYEVGWKEFHKEPARPFFLGESTYEGEHDAWGSPFQARKQAYWAMLSGGTGHAYGSPNWNFPANWRENIKRPGAQSMRYLRELFESIAWHQLVPDDKNRFATSGNGVMGTNDLAVSAVARDQSFAMTYFPTRRKVTYDLTLLKPHELRVIWFNPRTGERTLEGRMGKGENMEFEPAGEGDWVLLFE